MVRASLALLMMIAGCNQILGVHQFDHDDARRASDADVGADVTDTIMIDAGVAVQQAYIKAPNSRTNAIFGWGVALSADGNTMAIGSPRETSGATGINGNQADTSSMSSGAVYVYQRTGDVWTFDAYIKASNAEANDNFGWTVALSDDGHTLAVGAIGEASANGLQSDNSAAFAGAAYVFTRAGTWSQQAYLKASSPSAGDGYGRALALSGDGNTIAVASYYEDSSTTGINSTPDEAAADAGAVWVYTRVVSTWSQQAYIKPNTVDAGDRFGECIALSAAGNVLAVGAIGESSATTDPTNNAAIGAGAVTVFSRSGSTWSQRDFVKPMYPRADDEFGVWVSLSADGSRLAVSAAGNDSSATGVGGDQLDTGATLSGAAFVFDYSPSAWTQTAFIKATNTAAYDGFGVALALSADGNTLLVGADFEDGGTTGLDGDQSDDSATAAGAAYLWTYTTTWQFHHYIKASNTETFDEFAWNLAMSANGKTLAISSNQEDSTGTGINGAQSPNGASNSGATYVFWLP